MKKSIKVLGLLLVMLLFSGCMKSSIEMKINSDKSMDYSMIIGIDKSAQSALQNLGGEQSQQADVSSMFSEEDKKKAQEKGFTVTDYEDDIFKGYKITKSFKSIDDLSSENEMSSDINLASEGDKKIFVVKKGFLKDTYIAKLDYNNSKESLSSVSQYKDNKDYAEYFKNLDVSFNLTLPSNSKSNNATSVDGKNLKWDFTKFDKDKIEFEFEMYHTSSIIILAGGILALIAIVICVIVLLTKKKDSTKKISNEDIEIIDTPKE